MHSSKASWSNDEITCHFGLEHHFLCTTLRIQSNILLNLYTVEVTYMYHCHWSRSVFKHNTDTKQSSLTISCVAYTILWLVDYTTTASQVHFLNSIIYRDLSLIACCSFVFSFYVIHHSYMMIVNTIFQHFDYEYNGQDVSVDTA